MFSRNANSASAIVHLPSSSWVSEKTYRYWVHRFSSYVFCASLNIDFLNDSSRAGVKSIQACKLSELLCMIALAVRGEIAVTGDMMPTTVFGLSIMVRSKGFPTCTNADLVLLHQCVTVLATVRACYISPSSLLSRVLADTILGSISANVSF